MFVSFEEDSHGKWAVIRCRLLDTPVVTGTKQSLNIIERESNVSAVSEPYGPPVTVDGSIVKWSVSAIIPNPEAPPKEEKLTPREKALLSERADSLASAQFAASLSNPQNQQMMAALAKALTGMK